jgi:NADPH:quinone reductase-like Zn-dependent oxidoreductase
MKAVLCNSYGGPEVLEISEVPRPAINANEVLVQLVCSNVNIGDVRVRKADPWAVRLFFGFTKPKRSILGGTLSGRIVQIGEKVTKWRVGAEVFGTTELRFGTYAEFVVMNENAFLSAKPLNVSFESASSSVFGTTTAYDFIRKAKIRRGNKVLVYGASGSVGSAAVQLLKHFGTEVTAVCGGNNMDAVKSLGADQVLDYKTVDWKTLQGHFDVVYETVNKLDYNTCKSMLKREGTLILGAADFGTMLKGTFHQLFSKQRVLSGMIKTRKQDIDLIAELLAAGVLTPLIDRSYSLDEIREAHRYVESGRKRGNVVLEINS